MQSLNDQVLSYAAYHGDVRNKITHFFGVPLVTFSLFLFLSWFRFVADPEIPFSGATIFYICVFAYYLVLDWRIALLQMPLSLPLLWLADRAALLPFAQSLGVFGAVFVGGWIIQLIGHAFEGKRPALLDNVTQLFNAPLFLTVEVMMALGFRKELREKLGAAPTPEPALLAPEMVAD